MPKAGIYNPYWDSLGGGERYTAAFTKLLLNHGWQIDIQWSHDISQDINNRFGLDISQANYVRQLRTMNYKLLFWLSDGSLPTSLAPKTIIHFQFPFQNVSGQSMSNIIKSRFYKFVVNSQFTKTTIDKEFNIESTVIYPPIDTSLFSPRTKQSIILYIGRFSHLTQLKGHSVLINSFKHIHKQLPGWKLVLAGGTTVGATQSTIDKLRKSSEKLPIEIITNPSFKKIQDLCSTANIFWSASGYSADKAIQTEHFGITVVEAMAAGVVPIITNLGGHKEIVDHSQNGFLWDTPSQLERITLELIKAKSSKLQAVSQAAVVKSKIFDTSEFNRKFLKLI